MLSDREDLADLRGMDPVTLTPAEFERFVAATLTEQGVGLSGLEVQHLHRIPGTDGDYVIDVSARFEALGADFLVLIECKHQSTKVKRADVQVLADKVRSTGAHAPCRAGRDRLRSDQTYRSLTTRTRCVGCRTTADRGHWDW